MEGKVKVWDIWVRIFHWSLLALMGAAYLLSDDFLTAHAYAGYVILFLLAGRVVWGFVGTRHARFADFVYPARKVAGFMRDMTRFRHARYLGHNPAAGAMVIALIALVGSTALTGVMVYGMNEAAGPFSSLASVAWRYGDPLEDIHSLFAWGTLAFAGVHVLAAALESLHYRENLVAAMITGYKKKDL